MSPSTRRHCPDRYGCPFLPRPACQFLSPSFPDPANAPDPTLRTNFCSPTSVLWEQGCEAALLQQARWVVLRLEGLHLPVVDALMVPRLVAAVLLGDSGGVGVGDGGGVGMVAGAGVGAGVDVRCGVRVVQCYAVGNSRRSIIGPTRSNGLRRHGRGCGYGWRCRCMCKATRPCQGSGSHGTTDACARRGVGVSAFWVWVQVRMVAVGAVKGTALVRRGICGGRCPKAMAETTSAIADSALCFLGAEQRRSFVGEYLRLRGQARVAREVGTARSPRSEGGRHEAFGM